MKRAFMHEGKEDRSLEFAHPGKPCDEARLANIESTLGKVLPPRYREVIMTTGGGILGINTRVILDSHSSSRDDEVFHIDQMWGNGATTNGSDNNIDSVVPFLADEYQIPDSVLLFATSNSGMHGYFVINYYLEGYPPGSVLYVDDEINGQITKISDTFDQFIGNVQQDTESPSGRDYGTPQLTPVEGAKKGALSEDLIRMVDTAPVRDAEELVRAAAAQKVSQEKPYAIGSDENSKILLDIFMWLLSGYRPVWNFDDFAFGRKETSSPNFDTIIKDCFSTGENYMGFNYSRFKLNIWWDDRVGNGFLVNSGQGYQFKEDYLNSLFNTLRETL